MRPIEDSWWTKGLILSVIGVAITLFPVPVAFVMVEYEPDSDHPSYQLTADAPIGQFLTVSNPAFSGITFRIDEHSNIPSSTILELHIRSAINANDDIRVVKTTFDRARDGTNLHFSFEPLRGRPGNSYYIFVAVPDLQPPYALTLQAGQATSDPVIGTATINHQPTKGRLAFTAFPTRPLITALFANVMTYDTRGNGEDIFFAWAAGRKLIEGVDPYADILEGDRRANRKYPTYLPLFYVLSAGIQQLGWDEYDEWVSFMRPIFLFFHIGTAVVLYVTLSQQRHFCLATFAALFWLFSRWTVEVIRIAHIDVLAIFFLILSLVVFSRWRSFSLIAFGVSLALKQIGIFLLPLYLIWVWKTSAPRRFRAMVYAFLLLLSVPLMVSLPFLIWNTRGFIDSVLFSITRYPASHFSVFSVDALVGLVGWPAKFLFFLLLALIYRASCRGTLGRYTSACLAMATFIDFNSVLFKQYLVWLVPLILLVASDYPHSKEPLSPSSTN